MKKVSRRDLIILTVILAAFTVFAVPRIVFHGQGMKLGWMKRAKSVYYCPMHPTYTSDRPGNCPICNMKLVRKSEGEAGKVRKILYYRHPMGQPDISPTPKKDPMGMDYIPVYEDEISLEASSVPGHATVHLDPGRQQLIGVKLGTVEKRRMKKEIRTSGRVAFDAELYTAQREFVSAVTSLEKSKHGPYHEPLERAEELVKSVQTRLRLLGMSEEEIDALKGDAAQDKNLILPNLGNLGTGSLGDRFALQTRRGVIPGTERTGTWVWVYGNIYEYELPFVKVGSVMKVRVTTFPEKEFVGEVRGMAPVLDAQTRSVRVRAKVANSEGLLKPEMYVDLYLESELGEALAVPAEAVMETGERKIVFVTREGGHFTPREVTLGARAGDFYEVKSGLAAGEQVVVSGNFLVDSESRLQAALEGMGSGGEHPHGV